MVLASPGSRSRTSGGVQDQITKIAQLQRASDPHWEAMLLKLHSVPGHLVGPTEFQSVHQDLSMVTHPLTQVRGMPVRQAAGVLPVARGCRHASRRSSPPIASLKTTTITPDGFEDSKTCVQGRIPCRYGILT
jgi:hypothetical protein